MSCQVCTSMLPMLRQSKFQYKIVIFMIILKIVGSPDNFGTSTIKTQFLSFDVSFFKSVEELEVCRYYVLSKEKQLLTLLYIFNSLIVFK